MKTITQKLDPHAAACCSEPKNRYICISEESEGACTDTLFETLPTQAARRVQMHEAFGEIDLAEGFILCKWH